NFEVEKIKPLIKTYLGNLPAIHRVESWKDVGIRPPKGVVEKEVDRGMEPKSQVKIVFTGAFEWSQRNRRLIRAMADVLQLKLREVLREDMGGTYGVGCSASPSHFPYQGYRFSIGFGCDPQRVEELTKAVFVQIDSLKNFGTTEKYLTKVREKSIRQHEKNLKENGYWIRSLQFYDRHGENPGAILKGADVFMKSLSSQMIQAAAKQYLNEQNYVKVVLKPEKGSE
ncbi:MAG TPA: insulinase family protein, partial [Caldithrix sp.]|nr:insulinase family protein [Caldithrix sp.]